MLIKAQQEFLKYYEGRLGSKREFANDPLCLWECDRRRLDTAHEGEEFQPPFQNIERVWFPDPKQPTIEEFFHYLKTQSAYQRLPDRETVLMPLWKSLQGDQDPHRKISVTFPFWLVVGHKAAAVGIVEGLN